MCRKRDCTTSLTRLRISLDGAVRNNNNMRIGTASGINVKYAAVLFFFYLL